MCFCFCFVVCLFFGCWFVVYLPVTELLFVFFLLVCFWKYFIKHFCLEIGTQCTIITMGNSQTN